MRKRTKKAFLSILTAATIMNSTYPVYANQITVNMPGIIYENNSKQNISSGVVHENIRKFTTQGWWNINVLRINLQDNYTELRGLFNQNGIPNRDKVSSMVEKNGAVAGVNGDYFNYQPLPSAMGTLINKGEVISSPIELGWALPTFYITNSNKTGIEYLDRKMVATNLRTGNQVLINTVNKVTKDFDTVTLLNKNWGTKSIGKRFHNDLVEVLVVNNTVQGRRIGGDPFDIPQTGDAYVLGVRNENLNHFEAGDKVDLQVQTVPDVDGIKFAIGGGSIILKNGDLALTNIVNKGNEPRTGMGVNRDESELILVTIDGRDSSFKGVSQEMFGAILRELGAYNAINLDGGGSTTMAIKPADEDKVMVVNKPSDGGERSVVNAVGVFSNAPIGELSYLKLSTDDNNMFLDTSRHIKVKGYDENHNPVDIDQSLISYSSEGIQGEFTSNTFKATSSGSGKIIASYGDDKISGSMDIKVLGTVMDLSTKTTRINVDINSQHKMGDFFGMDKNGTQAKIYLDNLTFNVLGEIGEIKEGIFYSGSQQAGGAISAAVGNGVENILVSVGSVGTLVDGFETLDKYNFSKYPEAVAGNLTLVKEAREGAYSLGLNYDFSTGENTRAAYVNFGPKGLTFSGYPKKLGLWVKGDGSGTWLRATLKDGKGTEYVVDLKKTLDFTDWQYLNANIPQEASYPISLQRIYTAETDSIKKPSGQILIDGLRAYYPSPIGNMVLPTPSSLKDELVGNKEVVDKGYKFIVTHDPKGLNELVGYDALSTVKSRISKNKIGLILNGVSDAFRSGINSYALLDVANHYSVQKHYDVLFFSLNSSKSGIRATDSSQWVKLINDLETKDETNFILFLPTPIFGAEGFTDTMEADLLHQKLVEARERGKNIFVVQGSNSTTSQLKDGIRYIQLNTKAISSPDNIYDLSAAEFVVNGRDITYEIITLFPQPSIKASK